MKGVIIPIAAREHYGQTVVASLRVLPSLFLIAKDLKRLQLWASVNEADIGQIHAGQTARFTVDAFSGKTFRGTVSQIRLNAVMTQNVVTYTVVITTDNSTGTLLPYLTANVQFEVAHHEDVPSRSHDRHPLEAAQPNQIVADAREVYSKASRRRDGGGGGKSSAKRESNSESAQEAKNQDANAKNEDAKKEEPATKQRAWSTRNGPTARAAHDGVAAATSGTCQPFGSKMTVLHGPSKCRPGSPTERRSKLFPAISRRARG